MPKLGDAGRPSNGDGKKRASSKRPTFVNRGSAGLLHKISDEVREKIEAEQGERKIIEVPRVRDKISPSLRSMVVDINSVNLDPENARLHPERNLEAICQSLCQYGQVKPIVVRRDTMVVAAGNGTLQAARSMGWTKIAISVVDMTYIEAIGYGLADNRTAELAKWDVGTVTRLDRLLQEASHPSIGWSNDELIALRLEDWVDPPQDFPEVDENIETDHVCPRCGYVFSGGETVERGRA